MRKGLVGRPGRKGALLILLVALICAAAYALCVGAVRIPLPDLWASLTAKFTGHAADPRFENVLWHLRMPRFLLAISVGAGLSVAGALMQGMFRNPLADPALIGVSSGAALGAVTVIVLGATLLPGLPWLSDLRFLPLAAFIGALLSTWFVRGIAGTSGYTAVAILLLAGIAVNAMVAAVIGLSTFLADDAQLRTLSFWTLGSLGAANWLNVSITIPLCLVLVVAGWYFAPALNAMALGEAEAGHLGYSVERVKNILLLVTAAGIGACVAFTGVIGFVGLVIPHMIRLWVGPDHRWLVPLSAIAGAVVLSVADTISRTVAAPAELPLGVLTAGLGGPFFLAMLLKQRNRAVWS